MSRTWNVAEVLRGALVASTIACGFAGATAPAADNTEGKLTTTPNDAGVPKREAQAAEVEPLKVTSRHIGKLEWHTDYAAAYRAARESKKSLLLVFREAGPAGNRFETEVLAKPELENTLAKVERAIVPTTATVTMEAKPATGVTLVAGEEATKPTLLLKTSAFAYLYGGAGIAVLDLADEKSPTFGQVISAHAFAGRQHYGTYAVETILSLPPGTVTQRALVYAMRMHPERPQSVWGAAHPVLMQHARLSSQLMSQYGSVGHHDWGNRLSQIGSQSGLSPFEVAASSYGASPLIDAAFELIQNWRGSPAHWNGMAAPQRHFGYDMVQGPSGVWYGTGLFAN